MEKYQHTPGSEVEARIRVLQHNIARLDLEGALIIHHTNLFYFSGTSQSAHLFVPREGKPLLLVRKSFDRAVEESPIKDIFDVKSLKAIPALLAERGFHAGKIGLELDIIPYNTYEHYAKVFAAFSLVDISGAIKRQRMIKSPYEIDLLREAAAVQDAVFAEVPSMLKEGMLEIELASLFEAGMRRRGYSGGCKMRTFNQDFFMGNVNAGSSGAVPTYFDGPVGGAGVSPANNPQGAGWKAIGRNEPVYIDYTCILNGYTVDQTRMFCIGELANPMLLRAYAAALRIQDALTAFIAPGVICEDVYALALELVQKEGLVDNFMGKGQDKVRFVGHGVGLELDEYPIFAQGLKVPVEEGMVFALEPKFVFLEGAIGIENTHYVQGDKVHRLTWASQEIICLP